MTNSSTCNNYINQLNDLRSIIIETNSKSVDQNPDPFFIDNVNFFTKSFHINLCAHLESFLKDISFKYITQVEDKLKTTRIPHNLILWSFNKDKRLKDNELKFNDLSLGIKKKDLDDHISGSPYRTIDLFKKIGVDLESNVRFVGKKDKINSLVVKRNKILHYNDDASDISFEDIESNIDEVIEYMEIIDSILNTT